MHTTLIHHAHTQLIVFQADSQIIGSISANQEVSLTIDKQIVQHSHVTRTFGNPGDL